MKFLIELSLIYFLIIHHNCKASSFEFLSSEVFILPLSHINFSLPDPGVSYRSSLLNMPDLPSWLHYTYSPGSHSGFIYGTPPQNVSNFKLEVIATHLKTYNTSRQIFNLDVLKQPTKPNEVHFKIGNMNIEELIVEPHWQKLRLVLVEDLWPESATDGVITSLLPASHKGDALPLLPHDKEGVYVSFGSQASFSFALLELEMEVKPLWEHLPCPKYFKKASYERFFRQQGFAVDWCNFKLHTCDRKDTPRTSLEQNAAIVALLRDTPQALIKRNEVVVRSYIWDVFQTILIPLLVMLGLLTLLTLTMCCHSTNMDIQSSVFFDELFDEFPRMPTKQDIQMVHYAGVNRAMGVMRSVRGLVDARDYSPHLSTCTAATHDDTLPRSRTGSPSTLQRSSATPSRCFEDFAILNRPDPPPYHRNGVSQHHERDD